MTTDENITLPAINALSESILLLAKRIERLEHIHREEIAEFNQTQGG